MDAGSDLDLGWSGAAHNVRLPAGWTFTLALHGCDALTHPVCQVSGVLGNAGDASGILFSPPLPLVVAGMPLCLVNRIDQSASTGTADVRTGEIQARVNLLTDVYATQLDAICPRCVGFVQGTTTTPGRTGTCDSGRHPGFGCTPDGMVTVTGAAGDPSYVLSESCPPAGEPIVEVPLGLAVTTGTTVLAGSSPCSLRVIRFPDDACDGGSCTNGICTDCVAATAPGECTATTGGVQQACCSNDTARPCFPTSLGTIGKIERSGLALPPEPAWPDPHYPKDVAGARIVSTFCLPANAAQPSVAGMLGPGALILPVTERWIRFQPG